MNSVLISAGEDSGDRYGADLVRAFQKKFPDANFFGIGGRRMRQEGVQLRYGVEALSLVGIFEILSHLPRLRAIFKRIRSEVAATPPRAAVLIDSPDFNLRLARLLNRHGVPVLYYVSPTVWAWRKGRLKNIRRYVDHMMLIFPFEEEIYMKAGIPAEFVGHPLLESISTSWSREEFCQRHQLDADKPLICLLPGSRPSEIANHMPVLMDTVRSLRKKREVQFLLLQAAHLDRSGLAGHLSSLSEEVRVLDSHHYEAMAASDLALSACGTANLEAALLETPVIAFYRISPLTYRLGKPFVKIPHYSIVNILASRPVIPELIQKNFTAAHLSRCALDLLDDSERRGDMLEQFRQIKQRLGVKQASENTARILERFYAGIKA
jgi:lipid-A-disaccharide synthase